MRDEFMIMRQGKQFVLFAGLLDEAHGKGLRGIETDLIQVPTDANGQVAICKATVDMGDGGTFAGIGDASPQNVGRMIAPHIIRMAETRAKARALRDAVNIGVASVEELSDDADNSQPVVTQGARGNGRAPSKRQRPVEALPSPKPQPETGTGSKNSGAADKPAPAAAAKEGPRAPNQKARKSQIDLLKTLAEELRGEDGVARLEGRIGKSLADLNRGEADEWIDRLTPANESQKDEEAG